jgi:hypothetical protein
LKRQEIPSLAPLLPPDEIVIPKSSLLFPNIILEIALTTVLSKDSPDFDVRIVKVTGTSHLSRTTEALISLEISTNGKPISSRELDRKYVGMDGLPHSAKA